MVTKTPKLKQKTLTILFEMKKTCWYFSQ